MARSTNAGDHVLLVLTQREGRALYRAASEVMEHTDACEATFPDGQDGAAARRAYNALWRGNVIAAAAEAEREAAA